jgi:predicted restriction endonuclease
MVFLDKEEVQKIQEGIQKKFNTAEKEPKLKSKEMIFRDRIFRKIIKHVEENGKLSITDLYDLIFDKI